MRTIETRVRPKADRPAAEEQFLAMFADGGKVLFSLVDKPNAKTSGAFRLEREFRGRFSGVQSYRGKTLISNYFDAFEPTAEGDIQTLIRGLGTRFPCQHAWVLIASSVSPFLRMFGQDTRPIDQNSYLPDRCVVFSFGLFGALLLTVRVLEDFAVDRTLEKHEWRYFHLVLSEDEIERTRQALASISGELEQAYGALRQSVKSRANIPGSDQSQERVTLSPVAKNHFKQLGFRWNKVLSEPRVTVFDKVTSGGNIIRVSADAGGHADLIPYIDAQFISSTHRSPSVPVVNAQPVTSVDQLVALLELHQSDLGFFEESVAGCLDTVFPRIHEKLQRILLEQDVRAILQPSSVDASHGLTSR